MGSIAPVAADHYTTILMRRRRTTKDENGYFQRIRYGVRYQD